MAGWGEEQIQEEPGKDGKSDEVWGSEVLTRSKKGGSGRDWASERTDGRWGAGQNFRGTADAREDQD